MVVVLGELWERAVEFGKECGWEGFRILMGVIICGGESRGAGRVYICVLEVYCLAGKDGYVFYDFFCVY